MDGFSRNEMVRALRRRGSTRIPMKWDEYSGNFYHKHKDAIIRLQNEYGIDYIPTVPGTDPSTIKVLVDTPMEYSYEDLFGCIFSTPDRNEIGPACIKHPFDDVDTACTMKMPIFSEQQKELLRAPVIKARKENPDKFIWVQIWLGPWETLRHLTGIEEMLTSLYLKPESAEGLIEKMFNYFHGIIEELVRLDADMVGIADDWGTERSMLISPELWRKFFKKHYAKIFETIRNAHKLAFYHSCGAVFPIYKDLIEIGVDVLNPLQPGPMDIKKVAAEYKGQVSFLGGIDTRQTLLHGTPKDVEAEVINTIKLLSSQDGGFVAGHCTSIHLPTPMENVEAMYRTIKRFEW